jgi:hypothetical protein
MKVARGLAAVDEGEIERHDQVIPDENIRT